MLTALAQYANGNETVYECARVERIRKAVPTVGDPGVVIELSDRITQVHLSEADGATVYVMNESGATVAKYDL